MEGEGRGESGGIIQEECEYDHSSGEELKVDLMLLDKRKLCNLIFLVRHLSQW
jgi:hypothetical protein